MKKSSRRDHPSEPSSRNRQSRQNGSGRWEFSATGSLFTLGSTDAGRSTAYYTAGGELRFLPR